MHLYEVIRWGNDSEDPIVGGPNGPDTCFLVCATSVEQAAALADRELARLPHEQVEPWAHVVYLLGHALGTLTEAQVLRGPYVQTAYRYGWRHWYREERQDSWQEKLDRD